MNRLIQILIVLSLAILVGCSSTIESEPITDQEDSVDQGVVVDTMPVPAPAKRESCPTPRPCHCWSATSTVMSVASGQTPPTSTIGHVPSASSRPSSSPPIWYPTTTSRTTSSANRPEQPQGPERRPCRRR